MNSGNAAGAKAAAQRLMGGVFAVAPQVLFVLLPVFVLLLKIFYVFKRRIYMEHLIVAIHSHDAAWFGSILGLLHAAGWLWLLAYLLLMQNRVYRQGCVMTSLKYVFAGFCYSVLLGAGMVFALLVSISST